MRAVLGFVAVFLLAGCAPSPPSKKPEAVPAPLHTFAFAVKDVQASDPRITDLIQSDCGPVALARVPAIPINDALFQPDLVMQYDESGAQVRRWAKSYSSEILAISGNDLYFGGSEGADPGPFRTTPAGDVTLAVPLATNLEANARYVACPESLPGFTDMSLVSCYETTDVAGNKLWLAWEAGCP